MGTGIIATYPHLHEQRICIFNTFTWLYPHPVPVHCPESSGGWHGDCCQSHERRYANDHRFGVVRGKYLFYGRITQCSIARSWIFRSCVTVQYTEEHRIGQHRNGRNWPEMHSR